MTRAELISTLARMHDTVSPKLIDQSVREVLEAIIESLAEGKRVELRGFGTFELAVRPPRTAHNPRTKVKVQVGEKRQVRFRPGGSLRDKVNGVNQPPELEPDDKLELNSKPDLPESGSQPGADTEPELKLEPKAQPVLQPVADPSFDDD
ncbi:MAG: integration host factor subunit beta [Proteobacteria bacterium]|uniref:Integration host factor subunit beta n=1 Tax=Candidatus Avisuccinivibrio stercorigallinarum TaxID=2840704 RepID=A0A9D9DA50_9GAMM|nr:integration host factor subunit beta [Candidatus Avisuccinivibrio stercorigallinarum]